MANLNNQKNIRSPILDQILGGGSSVALNLIKLSASPSIERKLFMTQSLNDIYLFKHPNIPDNFSSLENEDVFQFDNETRPRPIETGIYVPHDKNMPSQGGYAIYLRSHNYEILLEDFFGLRKLSESPEAEFDFRMLSLIDSIPSLDPFLLKSTLDSEKIAVDPRYFDIDATEVMQIKELIRSRIEPIVRKAIKSGIEDQGAKVERFLDAIWNPSMPEAGLFVSAFGIDGREAGPIFDAWKGITFYEYQLKRVAKPANAIVTWLKSADCIPIDMKMYKAWEQNMLMYIEKIGTMIEGINLDIRKILLEYNTCYNDFMNGNPAGFRNFLRTIQAKYWLMGFCISSISSISHFHQRASSHGRIKRLPFEVMQRFLKQVEVAIDRRRERLGTL